MQRPPKGSIEALEQSLEELELAWAVRKAYNLTNPNSKLCIDLTESEKVIAKLQQTVKNLKKRD